MATLTDKLAGTFSGTGATSDDIVVSRRGRLKLSFGSGTVKLEEYSEEAGAFVATGDEYTSTGVHKVDGGGQRCRLNCTSHSSNITYELLPG